MSKELIQALLSEREGYVRRRLPDRVKQVDEELAKLGHKIEVASVHRDVETASREKPRPRKTIDE